MNYSIIKFGGSIITNPNAEDRFFRENAVRLCRELYPFHRGCVVVHGTGHVGKPPAIEHGYFDTGILDRKERLLAARIKQAIRRLNTLMVQTMADAGIPAVPLDVFHLFKERNSEDGDLALRTLLSGILSSGCVPVFCGDMIITEKGDFKVVSSDEITFRVARILKPENVIFLTDVDGVYEHPESPRSAKGARVIPLLERHQVKSIFRSAEPNRDVSGGMQRKVEIALETAKYSKICFIGSGLKVSLLEDFFNRDPINVTYVE